MLEVDEEARGGVEGRVGGADRWWEGERRRDWRSEVECEAEWPAVGLRERAPIGVPGREGEPRGVWAWKFGEEN